MPDRVPGRRSRSRLRSNAVRNSGLCDQTGTADFRLLSPEPRWVLAVPSGAGIQGEIHDQNDVVRSRDRLRAVGRGSCAGSWRRWRWCWGGRGRWCRCGSAEIKLAGSQPYGNNVRRRWQRGNDERDEHAGAERQAGGCRCRWRHAHRADAEAPIVTRLPRRSGGVRVAPGASLVLSVPEASPSEPPGPDPPPSR